MIVLHGLPGVGKTTISRSLCKNKPDLFFADLGSSDELGQRPMYEICISMFGKAKPGQSLLTEGVLPKKNYRDKFISEVISGVKQEYNISIVNPCIIYINERDMNFLSTRRNRSVEEYMQILNKIEKGSRKFDYIEYVTDEYERNNLDERIHRLKTIIETRID